MIKHISLKTDTIRFISKLEYNELRLFLSLIERMETNNVVYIPLNKRECKRVLKLTIEEVEVTLLSLESKKVIVADNGSVIINPIYVTKGSSRVEQAKSLYNQVIELKNVNKLKK